MDIATRAYNHTFKIDPIVRSLMDTDFYKLLMQQMILELHPNVPVKFRMMNRTKSIRTAEIISEAELREQLDYVRTLKFAKSELIWLAGNTFYGQDQMFSSKFLFWLENFQLPEYNLFEEHGQWVLEFESNWASASAWEIHALAIMNELRSRAVLKQMSRFEIDILYARAKAKLWSKVERLRTLKSDVGSKLQISDFGTRRRHGFLWQRWCIEALMEGIGGSFTGTSNVKHAMDLGLEAIGTNAHELPMVYAAMANSDEELLDSSYRVLSDWADFYGKRLQIILPDAYGTTNFLKRAPDWVAEWTGFRPDSKEPIPAVMEYVQWCEEREQDPMEKIAILSDGMDIDSIESCVRFLADKVDRTPIGWGTNLTNDFTNCASSDVYSLGLKPISLVCKVYEANGRPAVKLSDNPSKATGPRAEVERYMRVFGTDGMDMRDVKV